MPTFVTHAAEPRERFERPEEYAGYALRDPLGKKIGRAEELFVNGGGEPEYVRVRTGPFGLRRVPLSPWSTSPWRRKGERCCRSRVPGT